MFMASKLHRRLMHAAVALSGLALAAAPVSAGGHKNFTVAVYIPVGVVQRFDDTERLCREWERIRGQLAVDKVYVEVQRDRNVASDALLDKVKQFFVDQGVEVAGGMALSDGSVAGQFRSFCYTDPDDRKFIQSAAELAARHFDEVIQDDFFFVTTKYDSDVAAKGDRSWTEFRLDLLRDAAENLLIKPAKAVNPRVKMVIKYPNWYEHFQGLGYDLEIEPKLFDGIYTGTETRDPEITDQNLQQYESYLIFRYFENIKPGGNGGGWVDTYSIRYVDRYAEQLWDTLFAKAPEITLFEWSGMLRRIQPGERGAWEQEATSFEYQEMLASYHAAPGSVASKAVAPNGRAAGGERNRFGDFEEDPSKPTMARVAGYALDQVDPLLGKLGRPIGIKCYKPYQSWGEDYLHNYLGNIGIPIDLEPTFPEEANVVLLTESAKFDPKIVERIKKQLVAGKNVIITSGLLRALEGHGIEDVVEVDYTDRKILATDYLAGFGAGAGTAPAMPRRRRSSFQTSVFSRTTPGRSSGAGGRSRLSALALQPLLARGALHLDDAGQLQRPVSASAGGHVRDQELRDERLSGPTGWPQPDRPLRLPQQHADRRIIPPRRFRANRFLARQGHFPARNLVTNESSRRNLAHRALAATFAAAGRSRNAASRSKSTCRRTATQRLRPKVVGPPRSRSLDLEPIEVGVAVFAGADEPDLGADPAAGLGHERLAQRLERVAIRAVAKLTASSRLDRHAEPERSVGDARRGLPSSPSGPGTELLICSMISPCSPPRTRIPA